jgi:galactokinase
MSDSNPSSFALRVEQSTTRFRAHFGDSPVYLAAAPGRVNLIGEHTDYNDGLVFPLAIERYTLTAARLNGERIIRLASTLSDVDAEIDLDSSIEPGEPAWANYVKGVVAGFRERGIELPGFDCLVTSCVPLGGGLSSSAALEVSVATLLESISGQRIDPEAKALLCQAAEHRFAGVPCGIMDQFISVFGEADHLMLLDCRTRERTMVPFSDPDVTLLIINTNVKHDLADGAYAERRSQCETAAKVIGVPALRDANLHALENVQASMDEVVFRRARHVISENARTLEAAEAIKHSDWPRLGELMYASHASLRNDYEVSCDELDLLVELSREREGVFGCRMTGGGFGGCVVSLVRRSQAEAIAGELSAAYRERTGIDPTWFISRPARGARILELSSKQ